MSDFTVEHHAILFALIARAAQDNFSSDGREAVLEGIRRYGRQRGSRMAVHAGKEGISNDITGYLICGEIDFSSTRNHFKVINKTPYLEVCAMQCAWDHIWRKRGMIEDGKLYCQEIDRSIVSGYLQDFNFKLEGTLTDGKECCRFHYYDSKMGIRTLIKYIWKKLRIGTRYLRPWRFHTAELYQVLSSVFLEKFGKSGMKRITETALADFAAIFGNEAVNKLLAAQPGPISNQTPE